MCHKGPLQMTQVAEKCRVRNMVLRVYFYGLKEESLYLRKFWDNKLYSLQKIFFYISTDIWAQTMLLYYISAVKRSTLLKTVWWISEYDFPKLLVNGFSMTPATSLLMLIYFITQCPTIKMILWEMVANPANTALHVLLPKRQATS